MIEDLATYEQRIVTELVVTLGASLELCDVLSGAYGLLSKLVPADHGALCVSRPEGPIAYDWAVAEMPEGFFRGYEEILPHDFVRSSVARAPNRVLRDEDMLSRRDLEQSYLYGHCRSVGMPLEHVMAVMLAGEDTSWHGGLVLYRSRKVPFSDRERLLLQALHVPFTNAVKNCKRFSDIARRASLLDAVLAGQGVEAIVFAPSGKEAARTKGASAILSRWFPGEPRASSLLPVSLDEMLARTLKCAAALPPVPVLRQGEECDLKICFEPVLHEGRTFWALELTELPQKVPVPKAWQGALSSAELRVAERLLRGWDNALIASDLGKSELTVKKQVTSIFNQVGVSSRASLLSLAFKLL